MTSNVWQEKKPVARGISRRVETIETISVPKTFIEDMLIKEFGRNGVTVSVNWLDDDSFNPADHVLVVLRNIEE